MSNDLMTNTSQADMIGAVSSMPRDLAILKIENDSIQAIAAARPRNLAGIRTELEGTLAAFPQLAESAIYSKPVGKVIDCTCNDCKKNFEAAWRSKGGDYPEPCPKCGSNNTTKKGRPRQKFARGLSIRAAETLRETYGLNRVDAKVDRVDATQYRVTATFTDYQRGTIFSQDVIVPKVFTNRYGRVEDIDDARFFSLVLKAEQSKAIREVVSRSISPALKIWFEQECERIQKQAMTPEKVAKIIEAFAKFDIAIPDLVLILGAEVADWSDEHRQELIGIYTALKNNETTKEELLADDAGSKPQEQKPKTKTVNKAPSIAGEASSEQDK